LKFIMISEGYCHAGGSSGPGLSRGYLGTSCEDSAHISEEWYSALTLAGTFSGSVATPDGSRIWSGPTARIRAIRLAPLLPQAPERAEDRAVGPAEDLAPGESAAITQEIDVRPTG